MHMVNSPVFLHLLKQDWWYNQICMFSPPWKQKWKT